jgi:hypothetical protein
LVEEVSHCSSARLRERGLKGVIGFVSRECRGEFRVEIRD